MALVGLSGCTGAAYGPRVEKSVIPSVGVGCRLVRNLAVLILQTNPLYGCILGAVVDGLVLGGVRNGEYVTEAVVDAVYLVKPVHGGRAPYVHDGIAGSGGEQHCAIIGQG